MTTLDRTVSRPLRGLVTRVYEIDALTGAWNNDAEGATADQAASIQAQIDAIPNGSVIRFPVGKSEGKYYTQAPQFQVGATYSVLVLNNRHDLIIEGPSPSDPATFYTTQPRTAWNSGQNSGRRHWLIRGGSTNITFRNIRVEGSNYTYGEELAPGAPFFWLGAADSGASPWTRGYRSIWELETAFEFAGGSNCAIYDCEASDIWGDGLHLISNPKWFRGERFLVQGSGRQGVALTDCSDTYLNDFQIGTQFQRTRRAGIDLEPIQTRVVERVEIANIDMWMGNMRPIAAKGSSRVDDIYIHDVLIRSGTGVPQIEVGASDGTHRKNWRIENYTKVGVSGSVAPAIRLSNLDNVHLEGITMGISPNQSRWAIDFNNCGGKLVVKDNNWGNGCWIDYDATSSLPDLQGTNTFGGDCGADPLRNK